MANGDSPDPDRRKLLKIGAIGTAGAIVLSTQSDKEESPPDFTTAETEFQQLASFIDQRDLADPQQLPDVTQRIRRTLRRVEESLEKQGIRRSRHTPNSPTPTGPNIGAINSAFDYYTTLRTTLLDGFDVRVKIRDREKRAFNRGQAGDTDLQNVSLDNFGSGISDVDELQTQLLESSAVARLLPAAEEVTTGLRKQMTVYETHLELQEAFRRISTDVEAGSKLFEQSNFDQARTQFESAQKPAQVDIPSPVQSYALASSSLAISDYATIFSNYRTALSHLRTASDPDTTQSARDRQFDKALALLFDIRDVFAK
ncbi:hypothetical protein ACFR9U_14640 [Halorientalis brevis]|uniref:Uncharacterized protein n=1 Tax=Halorientalis brevis TaxID=1126241 RepID=A0ABD6CE68_9EURY|nr:hypothetical protein [Halorientalis brevis]